MRSLGRRTRAGVEFWPGFVDALSTMLIVIIFLVLVFVLAQFFLGQALSNKTAALEQLKIDIAQLTETLNLEHVKTAELKLSVSQLSRDLDTAGRDRDQAEEKLAKATEALAALTERNAIAQKDIAQRDIRLSELLALGEMAQGELSHEKEVSAAAQRQVELLNIQIAELRKQLAEIQNALGIAQEKDKQQNAQIADLGEKLNIALASKVAELAKYRSEFFGRLRQALGNRPDIQIVGDRFVFQSEVLFDPGSAELGRRGRAQILALAATLKELGGKIPADIKWVLRVDGHTDRTPIHNAKFASNWELSTARAIAVVKFLSAQGVPADRLAATGFAEFQPLEPGEDDAARKRNRRIELKLTER
jgi:chemotaxis protein MotB